MTEENEQPVFGETRYVDPNSGAAPQPGGLGVTHLVTEDASGEDAKKAADEEHPDGNVTMPGEERELSDEEKNDPSAGVEELPDEQVYGGGTLDTERQNQAMPLEDDKGVATPYAAPGVIADDDGNPLGADGEPATGEQVEQPGGNASKADWTEYAKSKGATDADLEGKTRDEIRDAYGS